MGSTLVAVFASLVAVMLCIALGSPGDVQNY